MANTSIENKPSVSVIMAVRNEAKFIRKSLETVIQQDYPIERIEILVFDGMSEDNTVSIVTDVAQKNTVDLRIVDNPARSKAKALNKAMELAKGDIIIFVDGHCEIAPDYISQCVTHLQKGDFGAVGGPIETIGQGPVGETIAVAMSTGFGVGGAAFRTVKDKEILVDTVAFGAYPRSVLAHVGLIDEELERNEDEEYNYRLRSLGYKILMSPDIHSRYYCRNSLQALWKQYYQYGFYKVRVFEKHPRQMQVRHFVPPLFVAGLIGGLLLSPFSTILRNIWLFFVVLYGIANLVISWRTAAVNGWKHLRWLPFTFATLHVSYGAGFLAGLLSAVRMRLKT